MRLALLLLAVLQGEAPVAQERERLRAKVPLTDSQKAEYASPEGPAAKPRASYTLTVVPLEFADKKLGGRDLQKLVFGGVAEYFAKASAGRFRLEGKVADRVTLAVERAAFERRDLEKALGGLPACDGVAFLAAGGLPARGTPLWPHRGVVRSGAAERDYLLVPEEAAPAIVAHEFMHLLGFADKYDDEKASVADACILGTGYSVKNPPPPCAECRIKLGWASAASVDFGDQQAHALPADPARALRIASALGYADAAALQAALDEERAVVSAAFAGLLTTRRRQAERGALARYWHELPDGGDAAALIASARHKLYAARRTRPAPARDDKVVTAWNGLAIAAFADAACVLTGFSFAFSTSSRKRGPSGPTKSCRSLPLEVSVYW